MQSVQIKAAHQAEDDLVEPMDDFSIEALLSSYRRDIVAMQNLRLALIDTGDRDVHRKSDQEVLVAAQKKLKAGQLKVQKDTSPCGSKLFGFIDLFSKMAKNEGLLTKPEFLMALALQESGWGMSHVYETNSSSGGQPLNNLFGLTRGGGDNLQFSSVEASGNYFIEKWGPYVKGSKTIEDFVSKLVSTPGHQWNTSPNYPISILGGFYVKEDKLAHIKKGDSTIGTYRSVLKWLKKCGRSMDSTGN